MSAPAIVSGAQPDSLRADSLAVPLPREPFPARSLSPATPDPDAELDSADLERETILDSREAVQSGLDIDALDAGAPNRIEPLFLRIPGRNVPEMRVNGLPVNPVRWPETGMAPVPLIAIEAASIRRYSPIAGPLSSTGGPLLSLSLFRSPWSAAISTLRLTQGSYGTFTDEIELRRPFRKTLFTGYYGDTKSNGRYGWGRQYGQTIGVRIAHRLAGGWGEWGIDDAFHRSNLLSTKRTLWDRTAYSARWSRPDTAGIGIEASLLWNLTRGAWDTALGRTERKGRALFLQARTDIQRGKQGLGAALEAEAARVHFLRPGEESRTLEDLSVGLAFGWENRSGRLERRASIGAVRLAPLAVAPIFAGEIAWERPRGPRLLLHASRAVRNRSLPRLPADGAAWVSQGIDLASETEGEVPEALWRLGFEGGIGGRGVQRRLRLGVDLLRVSRGLSGLDDLSVLGTDNQADLAPQLQRKSTSFASPWVRLDLRLPVGFRIAASANGAIVEGGIERHLGLPKLHWRGLAAWRGALFKEDLHLDLHLRTDGRTEVATPYGPVAAVGILDGEIIGSVGEASLFLVLANLMNVEQNSLSYDGGFTPLPLRNYRAGIRWTFLD